MYVMYAMYVICVMYVMHVMYVMCHQAGPAEEGLLPPRAALCERHAAPRRGEHTKKSAYTLNNITKTINTRHARTYTTAATTNLILNNNYKL